MNKTTMIIGHTFHCPDCSLIYVEGDTITTRIVNNKTIHDCDNCLRAIELEINNNMVTQK